MSSNSTGVTPAARCPQVLMGGICWVAGLQGNVLLAHCSNGLMGKPKRSLFLLTNYEQSNWHHNRLVRKALFSGRGGP